MSLAAPPALTPPASPPATFHCGFIAVVGRPNVGKSTLMNALTGAKISIVSGKAQTTRHRIHGVYTTDTHQFVFVDTPGFQTRHGGTLNRLMNRVVTQTLADVDVVLHVVEAGKWLDADARLLALLPQHRACLLVLNKVDAVRDKTRLYAYTQKIAALHDYTGIVPVSAAKGFQLDTLRGEIARHLPQGIALFEADALTDRPVRFLVAELLREKIFRLMGDELPYGCTVYIENWEEDGHKPGVKSDKPGVHISACVLIERENHRPMLLGAGGARMKRIASEARQDIVKLLDCPVHLEVYVKVRKGWGASDAALRQLGYD